MVPLNRGAVNFDLDDQTVHVLVSRYKATGEAVWKRAAVVNGLATISGNKCAYCETLLGEESKYLEVEHFYCKDMHPERVVDWLNLLPACKRCNCAKLDHDVAVEPIVDPSADVPRDHLQLVSSRLRGKTSLGKATIEVVNLNDFDRLVRKRFEVEQSVLDQVDAVSDSADRYGSNPIARTRNKVFNSVRALLTECLPEAAYAATAATALFNSDFPQVVRRLKNLGVWSAEFDGFYSRAQEIALL